MSANFFSNPPVPQKFQNFIIPSNSSNQYTDIVNSKENSVSEEVPHPQPIIIDEDIEYTPVEITLPEEPPNTDEEELVVERPDQPVALKQESYSLDYTPGHEDPSFIQTDDDRIWNNEDRD
eukprot:TRINITY_DN14613_c0_g1_i1.p1 TRINITY_DN14613_c0_g1~~TRINITY_DN14613_c0_g1_i1.p1  ORF type:complete len:121 (-),score=16.52 TRINITY_DN14613_c0_g1_i1:59-421(-)